MLVSPAEPERVKIELRRAVTTVSVSSATEQYGSDFLIYSKPWGVVGVQRKEVNDLIASVSDGRLAREVAQAKRLSQWVLLIEGRMQWTNDGLLMANGGWTISQHLGLIWSLMSQGFWTDTVDDLGATIGYLSRFERWLAKPRHSTLAGRPKTPSKSEFGTRDNRDWARWLLQSFEGIGVVQADAIIDHFGGVPLTWGCTERELMEVKGIGKVRAASLMRSLANKQVGNASVSATDGPTGLEDPV